MNFAVQIDLAILGSLVEPQEITRALGVKPDSALRKGERNPNLGLPKTNIWSKRSTAPDREAFLEQHWQSLARELLGKEELLKQISSSGKIILTIIVDGSGRIPSLYFPNQMIDFIAKVGGDLDIDINQ